MGRREISEEADLEAAVEGAAAPEAVVSAAGSMETSAEAFARKARI